VVISSHRAAPLTCTPVFVSNPTEGWVGWQHNPQETTLQPNGAVELRRGTGNPRIVSELARLETGGLYRIRVILGSQADSRDIGLIAHLSDAHGEWMGPAQPLMPEGSDCWFFVPNRTPAVKLSLSAGAPRMGLNFVLNSVKLEKVDAESYYRWEKHSRPVPVIAAMASIPSRRQMLRDAVESLLLQCDLVRVFLNEYPDVPEFLNHPRVQVRRSQDWDDKGDAGKFSWIGLADEPGYCVSADDDLLFPPDFVQHMIKVMERYDNRAIAAVHGVLMKHPFTNYYEPKSRSVFYFQEALQKDWSVHILGTNALIYHRACVKMTWDDFMFRNMADIFLARYAQRHRIPMICVERPRLWVRQNKQEGGFETIYDSSLKRNRSKFDSSFVQDGILKHIAPLTMQPTMRPKVALCLIATNVTAIDPFLQSWATSRSAETDWLLIVTAGTDDPVLSEQVAAITAPTELHILRSSDTTPAERIVQMLGLAVRLGAAAVCLALDCVRFVSEEGTKQMVGSTPGRRPAIYGHADGDSVRFEAHFDAGQPLPAVALFDAHTLKSAPPACPAGGNAADALRAIFARPSASASVAPVGDTTTAAMNSSFRTADAPQALAALASATALPRGPPAGQTVVAAPRSINELFEQVTVINLDRRRDRWDRISRGLERSGIRADRFRAVDGGREDVAAEYAAYAAQPLAIVGPGLRPVTSNQEFFFNYESQRSRVAFVEAKSGRKAIGSAGAWAYLKNWEQILEQALLEQTKTLLVFDDDVVFHKDTASIFDQVLGELPDDWLMLQLGTLQFHWAGEWMRPCGRFLYRTNGSAVGSHAVGIRLDMIPFLLDHVKRMELPFDIGAVAAATRAFKDLCFVVIPNVAIQRLEDSDIRTSDFQATRNRSEIANTHRWVLDDYEF
jgi:GR25 family glycosyltransferase involved in LPS biosynthesis